MPIVLYAKLRSQIQTTGIMLGHIQDMRMIALLRHGMLLLLIRGELATTIIIITHIRCFLINYILC